MKKPEKYWTYQAGDIPEVSDLPPGTFKGDEKAWSSLSPGMRREIYRLALRKQSVKKNPKKRRKAKKHRTRKIKRAISLRVVKRRKRKIQRVKRNPIGRFVICAMLENGKHFYFRKSTESFVAGLVAATRYRSAAVAMRTAKLLLKQLPREIVSIKVDQVKR